MDTSRDPDHPVGICVITRESPDRADRHTLVTVGFATTARVWETKITDGTLIFVSARVS